MKSASLRAPSGIVGLLVVAALLFQPTLWNKLFVQNVSSRLRTLSDSFSFWPYYQSFSSSICHKSTDNKQLLESSYVEPGEEEVLSSWVNDNTEAKETKKVSSKADVKTIKARGKNDINKDRTFFQFKPKEGEVHFSTR